MNYKCIEISNYTGIPEMLGGRIKTLNLLEDATSAWTNPNDWGEIDKQLN